MAKNTKRSRAEHLPNQAEMAAYTAGDPFERTLRNWQTSSGSADSDLIPELPTMVPRSRDLSRNNGIASAGIQTLKDNIVGHTLRLSAKPHYRLLGWSREQGEALGKTIETEFEQYAHTTECDASRQKNLLGLTLQMLSGAMVNGEALAIPVWASRPGTRWNTRLHVIESDRLDTPSGMQHNVRMRGGVEVDSFGAPTHYWIRKNHPGDQFNWHRQAERAEYQRVPAFTPDGLPRVIHLFDPERAGQSRGRPIVSAVMKEFKLIDKYADAHLETAIAQSLIAAFLESDLPPDAAAELFGQQPDEVWKKQLAGYHRQLTGSSVIPLPAGAKLTPFNPSQPNPAFESFMESAHRHIAAGMNMPYELLLKDFSRTNYSSARAALLEAWRYFKGRRKWLIDGWLRPVLELWMEEAAWRGRLDGLTREEYLANRYAYTRARWTFAGRGWVDPVKEARAAQIRMTAGLSTLEDECAEQGLDWEEVLEQRARERDRMNTLGLLDLAESSALASANAEDRANETKPEAAK